MPYDAKVVNVMIASPGDVPAERAMIASNLHEWNAINAADRKTVLLPVAWETHATPSMAGRPQGLINEQLVKSADLLVAVFWTRLGSPTGASESGTVEEIEEHIKEGRPVMIYFSSAPVEPSSIDPAQYRKLTEFKESLKTRGLYEQYDSLGDFASKFGRNLSQTIIRDFAFGGVATSPSITASEDLVSKLPALKPFTKALLLAAAADRNGRVYRAKHMGGLRCLAIFGQCSSLIRGVV